jgi:conjugative relaxase-like TrwC/TraI family protein
VLSIGKLVAGQAKYYLDQAEGRVDAVESIGDGLEDYYAGGAEARGTWLGSGSAALGLVGPVDGEALRRVLGGLAPDGVPLRNGAGVVRVAGFDLTFSAPKSVSVIFGVGKERIRQAVRAGHDRAVAEALAYLERSAAGVRRGQGGARVEPADGLVAAAFRHRTSRAGDPQLHTHVLVANLGRGPDGRWSALDGRRIYAHARTASFLYQAVLRSELTCALGVEWTPARQGIAEVFGVPTPVLRTFSRRRAEIDAALAEHGTTGARAAEAAALATRRAKSREVDAGGLIDAWRAEASEHGFTPDDLARVVGRARTQRLDTVAPDRVFAALAAPSGLTRRASTFTRRDVIQALCERLPAAPELDGRFLENAADRFLRSSRAVALIPETTTPETAEVFRRRDGRLLPLAREELRYSTPELLALEQRVIERVVTARGAGTGVATNAQIGGAVAARPALAGEQRVMVEHLCRRGDGVAVVVGKAGAGKTFALAAAREAWQAAGYPVLGAAIARRAARELQDGAGIASTSVSALLADLQRGVYTLPERCVLVVDEAGMLPTRQLAAVLEEVEQASGKLVLVGDHHQLQEIEAGGAFLGLVQRGLAIELTENRRQVHPWERVALDHLREGRADEALALYGAHDRIVVERDAGAARDRLVGDWWATDDAGEAVMIAHRRADVAELNDRARRVMREAGRLGAEELALPGGLFAAGDRVVVKRNDLVRGIHNGDRATVAAVDRTRGRLTLYSGGDRVVLDASFLYDRTAHGEPTLLHGYAITAHAAQGLTVDHAFVLADGTMSRELAYTALSRGRHTNRLYLAAEAAGAREEFAPVDAHPCDPLDRLAAALRASSATSLAVDVGRPFWDPLAQDDVNEAERALRSASADRRKLETAATRWLPGRRHELTEARLAEAEAASTVQHLRRVRAERDHAARPFLSEQDLGAQPARTSERLAECRFDRTRARDRGIEL